MSIKPQTLLITMLNNIAQDLECGASYDFERIINKNGTPEKKDGACLSIAQAQTIPIVDVAIQLFNNGELTENEALQILNIARPLNELYVEYTEALVRTEV